ncbi:MAG: hypothetical protein HZB16_16595 [Armatimonadetes bacterium]|nr:hypothetical protein [Armatimonadota bacterium]
MDRTQRVEFPPPRRPWPVVLGLLALGAAAMVAGATMWVVVAECLPAALGADLLDRQALGMSLLVGILLFCGCALSAPVWLACCAVLTQPSRAERVALRLWGGLLLLGVAVAMASPFLAAGAHDGAEQRFVAAMAPLLTEIRRQERAAGYAPASLDTITLHRPLLAALPRAGGLQVVYERQRTRLRYPGLVFELDAEGVVGVSRDTKRDEAATRRWHGKSDADIRRVLGRTADRSVSFEAPWRVFVIQGDQALVYLPGHPVGSGDTMPWRAMDVCKNGLLDWDPNPYRYR